MTGKRHDTGVRIILYIHYSPNTYCRRPINVRICVSREYDEINTGNIDMRQETDNLYV